MPRFIENKSCVHTDMCDCDVRDEEWLVAPEPVKSTYDKVASALVASINRQRGVSNVPANIDYEVTRDSNGLIEWELRHQITGAEEVGYGTDGEFIRAAKSFAQREDEFAKDKVYGVYPGRKNGKSVRGATPHRIILDEITDVWPKDASSIVTVTNVAL